MASLVHELQRDATNAAVRVADLLRKAVLVASKLGVEEFRLWAEGELRGYPEATPPPYRRVHGQLRAHNPVHGWIPVVLEDAELQEKLEHRDIGQPVGELEDLYHTKGKSDTLQIPLPQQWLLSIFSNTQAFRLGMVPTLLVGRSQILAILDGVRNEVLRWSIELEKRGVLGEGMMFSQEERDRAASVTYNIGTFTGVLGDVTSSQLQFGDYASIHHQLKVAGVPQDARNELETILDEVKEATPEKRPAVVRRGMDWLAKYGPAIGTLSDTIRGWFEAAGRL